MSDYDEYDFEYDDDDGGNCSDEVDIENEYYTGKGSLLKLESSTLTMEAPWTATPTSPCSPSEKLSTWKRRKGNGNARSSCPPSRAKGI
jgi:hypothetical protein